MRNSFSNISLSRRFSADSSLVWLLLVSVLGAILFGVQWWINRKRAVFLTTTSPDKTYSVNLKGDKRRPFIIPNEVKADVFKTGKPFVSDIWLHSAMDSFDLSFEAGFPDLRWLSDSTIEFYRAQYFEKGVDSLVVSNKADTSIKYLRVQSQNMFLMFDMRPGTSVSLELPAPRGDSQWIAVQGAFMDGTEVPFNSKTLNKPSNQRQHSEYELVISKSGSVISLRQ